jgi:hypothetical protein
MNKFSHIEKIDKMTDDVINNFDFKMCHDVMRHLKWTWLRREGHIIPTIEMISESARERIKSAIDGILNKEEKISYHHPYYSSSGGLKATVWKNNYGHIVNIQLEFILSEWDSDGDY